MPLPRPQWLSSRTKNHYWHKSVISGPKDRFPP
ncbi:Uncharacterised protein [Vibrio cholerae]|nr:Uncharacterised protein [Vibrio cholerae]